GWRWCRKRRRHQSRHLTMSSWRDIKRKKLAEIHRTFQLPAVYLTHAAGVPIRVNVRLHRRQLVGEFHMGEWTNAAAITDVSDRVIFRASEVGNPLPRSYVIFSNTEVYQIGPTKPEREGYIWTDVSEVSKADVESLLLKIDPSHAAYQGLLS